MVHKLQRLTHLLMVAVLMIALGIMPVLVQTVAWANMLVEYSRTTTFTTAVAMTFDGQHPCELCRKVQKQDDGKGERQPQTVNVPRDVVFFHEGAVVRVSPLITISLPQKRGHDPASLVTRSQKPPVPPPRGCA